MISSYIVSGEGRRGGHFKTLYMWGVFSLVSHGQGFMTETVDFLRQNDVVTEGTEMVSCDSSRKEILS